MNLYLIERTDDWGWDDYDKGVVVASTLEIAQQLHPTGGFLKKDRKWSDWPTDFTLVKVTLVGIAVEGLEEGESICASFNAG